MSDVIRRAAGWREPAERDLDGRPTVIIDRSHLGRRASGIERITRELFTEAALEPLPVVGLSAGASRWSMMVNQMLRMPVMAVRHPRTLWVFSGYPPCPVFAMLPERSVLYVHDLFLITRRHELNRAAKIYMVEPFRIALKRLRYFLVNSEATGAALRSVARPGTTILPYRPPIRNVFGLADDHSDGDSRTRPLVVGAMGTIEPRKNYLGAAAICEALGHRLGRRVELHVIGRAGWGVEAEVLAGRPNVTLLGFLDDAEACQAIERFDLFLCSSHDEGLGLPLLEMQFGGLLVVAPDKPVFREVLGNSGVLVQVSDPKAAAAAIAETLTRSDWREAARQACRRNLARWNRQAEGDRRAVIDFLERRLLSLERR